MLNNFLICLGYHPEYKWSHNTTLVITGQLLEKISDLTMVICSSDLLETMHVALISL